MISTTIKKLPLSPVYVQCLLPEQVTAVRHTQLPHTSLQLREGLCFINIVNILSLLILELNEICLHVLVNWYTWRVLILQKTYRLHLVASDRLRM